MSMALWERQMAALLEEFWVRNKGMIHGYSATFNDGTKLTLKFSKKKRPPVVAPTSSVPQEKP